MSETYLFRAKLEFNWDFDEVDSKRRLLYPSQLPTDFGPFLIDHSPNAEFYLEELGWNVRSSRKSPDYNYPVTLLYVDTQIQVKKGYDPEGIADETFEQLEALLRLFQKGDVYIRRHLVFEIRQEQPSLVFFLRPQPIKPAPATLYPRDSYKLDDATLQRFIAFFNDYSDIINQKQQPISNALFRFSSSYEQRTLGDRLLELVMTLEALFGSRGDSLTYKIALRCSSFLYPPGEERREAFEAIKKVYDDRSAIVHGEKIDSKYTSEEMDQLEQYVRRSITTFLEQFKKGNRISSGEELDKLLFFTEG